MRMGSHQASLADGVERPSIADGVRECLLHLIVLIGASYGQLGWPRLELAL